jgi:tRNA modification GTPase
LVFNKVDLVEGGAGAAKRGALAGAASAGTTAGTTTAATTLRVSARTGAGLADLRAHLQAAIGYAPGDTGALSARARHLDALARARGHLDAACALLADKRGELVAEELRGAQQALGEITGEFTSDDLLGRIFGSFCIGK